MSYAESYAEIRYYAERSYADELVSYGVREKEIKHLMTGGR